MKKWAKVYPENNALKLIDYNFAKEVNGLPMKLHENTVHFALAEPLNKSILESVYLYFKNYNIEIYYLEKETIDEYTEHFFNEKIESLTSVVETIENLIEGAILKRASDIHIEPFLNEIRIRFRIDGILETQQSLSLSLSSMISTRIKIMSNIDIAGTKIPRDGSIKGEYNKHKGIDFRVSTMPTIYGEKIVIRLIYKEMQNIEIDTIFSEEDALKIKELLKGTGIILLTGPTGSGKTTTLYSFLKYLNTPSKNIITIEDPVENTINGITHVSISKNLGFAEVLRHSLRQDPNIIMIGEIRDKETAKVAIRAANTGHLVLSTMHTNDAKSATTRLIELGAEKFMIDDVLKAVIAQRLFRKYCSCMKKEGCENCFNTGFKGRKAIYEILTIENKKAILHSSLKKNIEKAVKNNEISPVDFY